MYIDDLRTLRVAAGLKIARVASHAGVSRSTIERVEKHQSSTVETLNAIINALNDLYYNKAGKMLEAAQLITSNSRYS